ncbi:MAG TPA: hypothetical protein VNP92_25150 [Actinophytocola sp.]|nr:hypothetical protein [Actinophytocola sp.]
MQMHEHMSDAVADVHADTERLTGAARAIGGRTRRRRRVGAIGAVAAAGVLAVGLAVTVQGEGPAPSTPAATDPSDSGPPSDAPDRGTVPIDGRSTAAALRAAVLAVTEGETTAYAGQSGFPVSNPDDEAADGMADTWAEFELTPASGGGPGVVSVNVQHSSILDGFPFDCSAEWMVDCQVQELPGGDRLRTYSDEPTPTAEGDGLRVVAEYFSTRRELRVLAAATNGFDLPNNQWDVTRPEPVLTVDQLADVVTEDWWGFELPARFADEGQQLDPYDEIDGSL